MARSYEEWCGEMEPEYRARAATVCQCGAKANGEDGDVICGRWVCWLCATVSCDECSEPTPFGEACEECGAIAPTDGEVLGWQ